LTYKVLLSRQAEKFFEKLRGKIKARVRESLLSLENAPFEGKHLHGDLKTDFSLRVDKLRIVYQVSEKEKTVIVVAIGPRKKIYREF
jgi:mRNA-degrading endonuclease RelE of RelBE toxin-antitoxin system